MINTFHNTSEGASTRKGLPLLRWSMQETNTYFFQVCWAISLPMILLICAFLPSWLVYIQRFGTEHIFVTLFEMCMNFSLWCFILFMVAFQLFNKTHSEKQSLNFWSFMADITWPLFIEGLKAACIILCGLFLFVIPGIIKQVRLTFLPYVICFNRFYQQRKLSALQHSDKLSRGIGWMIFILFICIPSCIHEGVRFIVKHYFYKPTLAQYGFFEYSGVILSVYVGCVAIVYLFSILILCMWQKIKSKCYILKKHDRDF